MIATETRKLIRSTKGKGYFQDAGVNSVTNEDNYYFFSLGEWFGEKLAHMKKTGAPMRTRVFRAGSQTYVEMHFTVDIMDENGNYCLTKDTTKNGFIMTAPMSLTQLTELANIADTGAMNCRLTGRPEKQETFTNTAGIVETMAQVKVSAMKGLGGMPGKVFVTYMPFHGIAPVTSTLVAQHIRDIRDRARKAI